MLILFCVWDSASMCERVWYVESCICISNTVGSTVNKACWPSCQFCHYHPGVLPLNQVTTKFWYLLTHSGGVMQICVSKLTIIRSDNGLSPGPCQAIIWNNAGILLIGTLGRNFCDILSEICTFSFKKMHLKILSAKWGAFCLSLNVLNRAFYLLCKG